MAREQQEREEFDPLLRRALRRVGAALAGPPARSSYWLTRAVFMRGLGLVYAVAFATAVFQLAPLIGAGGLTPVDLLLRQVREDSSSALAAFYELPTVFWFDCSDAALVGVAIAGLCLSIAVLLGLTNAAANLILWALYLSIVHVGQRWYSFGWETQLLETGFLAVLLCPLATLRPLPRDRPPPLVTIVLLRWLVFRIMLGAGLIKLRGDPCWLELTCLEHHFETQPLPNPVSPLLDALPAWALQGGVLINHVVELVAPLFVFGPRRARHVAGVALIGFQLFLIVSGNLSFLNWLTIVPCVACFDDQALRRVMPGFVRARVDALDLRVRPRRAHRIAAGLFAALVAWLSMPVVANLLGSRQAMNRSYDRLHLVNTYGAFGSVGEVRHELIIEGTDEDLPDEAALWREYAFKCKPGDPARRPCVVSPYHLRLDWLIWFAALEVEATGELRREAWVLHLLYKLLEADPGALSLLAGDPFPVGGPRFVRVLLYRYEFAPLGAEAWWRRELVGVLIPPVAADDPRLRRLLTRRGWLREEPVEEVR
ncbi:MAG: lipase maturation factor family protein [Myxococcales bacterium]|nr:lipase maturation factor family protein [Myxococcales bacterium]